MTPKAVVLALIIPVLGCSPIESAVLGGVTGLWQKVAQYEAKFASYWATRHEMLNLEKRVEHLEKVFKERNCR